MATGPLEASIRSSNHSARASLAGLLLSSGVWRSKLRYSFLFAVCRCGLLPIAEGDLDAEGAIGGQALFTDGEASGGIGRSVDDQLGISDEPEGTLPG